MTREELIMKCDYERLCVYGVNIGESTVSLLLSGTPSISNGSKLVFRFKEGIEFPKENYNTAVSIIVNGTAYPLWNRFGNPMVVGDLRKSVCSNSFCPRVNYLTYFGETTPHFIVHNMPAVTCSYYAC